MNLWVVHESASGYNNVADVVNGAISSRYRADDSNCQFLYNPK